MVKKLNMGTVCSGVGAPEVAFHDLFNAVWASEFDRFPSAVLAHRFPDLENLGDMTKLKEKETYRNTKIDLLVGGTPCQGFSVAGGRGGLENDERAQLTLEFVRILQDKQPKWFIWENVPGVLSSGKGEDFKAIIEAFTNVGYGVCWRVLDAQHFGVPQRRRRVFVVGYLGDWRPSYRVLFESESLRGNIKKSKSKAETTASKTGKGTNRTVSGKTKFPTLTAAQGSKQWLGNQEAFSGDYFISQDISVIHGTQDPCVQNNKAFCLGLNNGGENVISKSVHENQRAEVKLGDKFGSLTSEGGKPGQGFPCLFRYSKSHRKTHIDQRVSNDGTTNALNTGDGCSNQSTQNIISDAEVDGDGYVRKLTPLECERLQGFPDDWTRIPYRNKPVEKCPKGPRYMAMGNSMAVPVMRWIGERMFLVNSYMELQEK